MQYLDEGAEFRYFDSSPEAYGACQCDETITADTVLVIRSERVIGIANTWPVAVTIESGSLESFIPGIDPYDETDRPSYTVPYSRVAGDAAVWAASQFGWAVRSEFQS